MFTIDQNGVIRDARVHVHLIQAITHQPLLHIDAIVVHETDSYTAAGTMESWRTGPHGTGAHFLIDKDGTIYQTVPIKKRCWHVAPIRSRCLETHTCSASESAFYAALLKKDAGHFAQWKRDVDHHERTKKYPARYPGNDDSIGIEIVGKALHRFPSDTAFEPPTDAENHSLQWLVRELLASLHLTRADIYRHPPLSYKTAGEAAGARW